MLSRVTSKTTCFSADRVVSTIHRTKVVTSRARSTVASGRHVAKSSLPGSAQWLLSRHRLPNITSHGGALGGIVPSPLGYGIGAGASARFTCIRSAATFTITPMGSNRKNRSKSTAAVAEEEEEDGHLHHLAEAAPSDMMAGGIHARAHREDWMINLGREDGKINEWLTGPRSDEWYTGVHPSQCPGKCTITYLVREG